MSRALPRWALTSAFNMISDVMDGTNPLNYEATAKSLLAEIRKCLSSSPGTKSRRLVRAKKKAARKDVVSDVRPQVEARANGICECGCGLPMHAEKFLAVPEWDEFWGRANARPTVENTWMLRRDHHDAKGNERPSRRAWLELFRAHCIRHEYWGEAAECGRHLAKVDDKAELSRLTKRRSAS